MMFFLPLIFMVSLLLHPLSAFAVPIVSQIVRAGPISTPASHVYFDITFSEAVLNVDVTDFSWFGPGSGVDFVSYVNGNTYRVSVSVSRGAGTVGLDIRPDNDIANSSGQSLVLTYPSVYEMYDVSYAPQVSSVSPTFRSNVTVSWTGFKPSSPTDPIVRYEIIMSGGAWIDPGDVTLYTFKPSAIPFADGNYSVYVVAYTETGVADDFAFTTVTVDSDPGPYNGLPPVLDLDASAYGFGYANCDVDDPESQCGSGRPADITDEDDLITDDDSSDVTRADVFIMNPKGGDYLILNQSQLSPPLSWNPLSDVAGVVLGASTHATYQAILNSITISNSIMAVCQNRLVKVVVYDTDNIPSNDAIASINLCEEPVARRGFLYLSIRDAVSLATLSGATVSVSGLFDGYTVYEAGDEYVVEVDPESACTVNASLAGYLPSSDVATSASRLADASTPLNIHLFNATDSDGDGIADSHETLLGTNPNSVDSDGDGLVDGAGGVVDVNDYPGGGGIDIDGDGFVDGEQDLGTDPAVSNLGDLAPRGTSDNLINLGDLLMLMRLVTGAATPSELEMILGDINGDTLLNTPDILLLQRAILNGTTP